MKVLEQLLYTKEHEWIKVEGDKVYMGITDHAQHALGAIVYVELPEVDSEFSAGDSFAVVESVKAASDVYIPVDGKVIEVNEEILDDPALVNANPYENWMVCMEIADASQLNGLMNASEYEEFCSKEA
jgi:glycine cleavage system H protein